MISVRVWQILTFLLANPLGAHHEIAYTSLNGCNVGERLPYMLPSGHTNVVRLWHENFQCYSCFA